MISSPRTERAVARSLAETADPRDALSRALRVIAENLGWRLGAVWEPAPDGLEALRCVELWHAPDSDAAEFERISREMSLAPGEGLPGRVWLTGEAAWVSDVMADENFPRAAEARRAGLHAGFCFPIRSAGGVLGDQVGQAVERRRDAEELSANEARHRAMLDAALDCVVTMDHEGRVVDFNPAAERTFGYTVDEAVGRDMAERIIPPELRERHRQGLARYLETAEGAV